MNDDDNKTPTSPDDAANTAPDAATERIDDSPASAAPAARAGASATAAEPAISDDRRGRRARPLLIGAGAAIALLVVGGGAFALGAAVADDDDRPRSHAADRADAHGHQAQHPRGDDDVDNGEHGRDEPGVAAVPADAAALRAAAEAAIAHASGKGITAIEIERGGYDVDVRLADGTERELFVSVQGTASERGDGVGDRDGDPLIELSRLGDILTAAQSAATDAGANETAFHALATRASGAAYEVELRTGVRESTEVELDAGLAVVRVDIDD